MDKKNEYQDEGLKGNERIEDAIFALQKEATQEQLAHTLTVIRRRMKEGGQLIVAVEPDPAQAQMKLQTVRTPDGKIWWSAGCLKQHLLCRRSQGLLSIPGTGQSCWINI